MDVLNVFPPNSNQYVFTSSFPCDPNLFCKFSMHVPRHSQQHHMLKSHDLCKLAKGNNSIILCWECKFLPESVQSFRIFWYANQSDSLHNLKSWTLGCTPQMCTRVKARHLEYMLGPSHWLREICLPKRVCHNFLAWANTYCKEHHTYLLNIEKSGPLLAFSLVL